MELSFIFDPILTKNTKFHLKSVGNILINYNQSQLNIQSEGWLSSI